MDLATADVPALLVDLKKTAVRLRDSYEDLLDYEDEAAAAFCARDWAKLTKPLAVMREACDQLWVHCMDLHHLALELDRRAAAQIPDATPAKADAPVRQVMTAEELAEEYGALDAPEAKVDLGGGWLAEPASGVEGAVYGVKRLEEKWAGGQWPEMRKDLADTYLWFAAEFWKEMHQQADLPTQWMVLYRDAQMVG